MSEVITDLDSLDSKKLDLNNLDKSSWKTYRFDEIAKNVSERVDPNNTDLTVYIGLEHLDSESLHIKRNGTPDDVNGTKLKFYKGDIIFGRRRAYQRKAGIATSDGFCSAHALVLRANPDVINPKLFPFFLHSDLFMHRAVDISAGSLSPTINWGTLKHQEFLVPPIEIQSSLANFLWAANNQLATKVELSTKANELTKSIIYELITLGKKSTLKPKSFANIPFEDLVISEKGGIRRGPFGSALKKEYFIEEGIKVYEQSNVIKNNFVRGSYFIDEAKFEKLKAFEIKAGDILISCSGTVGKVAVVPSTIEKGIMNQALLRARLNYDLILPKYFMYLFESEIMQLKLLQKTQGSAMKNLVALVEMKKIEFPVVDKETQKKIVSIIEKQRWVGDEPIKQSKSLQNSIINQVF
jgi:type I restriction enzyme S subunit